MTETYTNRIQISIYIKNQFYTVTHVSYHILYSDLLHKIYILKRTSIVSVFLFIVKNPFLTQAFHHICILIWCTQLILQNIYIVKRILIYILIYCQKKSNITEITSANLQVFL